MIKKNKKPTENTIPAGYTLDYVSGKQVKETKKELVRIERCIKWLKPGTGRMGIVLGVGQPCRRIYPLVDHARNAGARICRPAGGSLHRRGERQHPHQPIVPSP